MSTPQGPQQPGPPPFPQQPPPAQPKRKPFGWVAMIIATASALVVGSCMGGVAGVAGSGAPQATVTKPGPTVTVPGPTVTVTQKAEQPAEKKEAQPKKTEAPKKAEKTTPAEQVQAAAEKLDAKAKAHQDHTYTVTFEIADNFTKNMIQLGAHRKILDLAEAVAKADPKVRLVHIMGSFTLVNTGTGKTTVENVIKTTWTAETLADIDWGNKVMIDVEKAADSYWRNPAMDRK